MEEMPQADLRALVRLAIEERRAPSRVPMRIWGGAGSGDAQCAVCRLPVQREELGFELDLAGEAGACHMHVRCYHAWEAELRNSEPGAALTGLPAANSEGSIRSHGRDRSG
jgi:hypothetical protein